MRKQYLSILGLDLLATDEQIKKAWKKKVIEFHPDKNPSKSAQAEFIKICDAYEKLCSDSFIEELETKSKSSDNSFKKYNKKLTPEELEIRLQKAREHAKYKEIYEENIRTISFTALKNSFLYKFSNVIAVISILIGSTLLLDHTILPPKEDTAVILNYDTQIAAVTYLVYDLNYHLPIEEREYTVAASTLDENIAIMGYNNFIKIYKTPILNENVAFSGKDVPYEKSMANIKSIYIAFWIFMILLYLPLLNFIIRGPNMLYLVMVHVNAYLPIFAMIALFIGLLH